jgi:hypothetical protein
MKRLNPVQQFALYGGLCIAGLSVVLAYTTAFFVERHLRETEWTDTAAIVTYELEKHNLISYWTDPQLHPEPARYGEAFEFLLGLPEVVRIKLWDREATVLWSDDDRLIGKRFPENQEVQQALAGRVAVGLKALPKTSPEYERDEFTRLAEIFVPVRAKPSGDIVGTIEVYKLPVRLFAGIRRIWGVIWGVAISGGILLYVVLLPIVRRSYHKRLELEARLQEYTHGLEAAVQERTRRLTYLNALSQLVTSSLELQPVFEYIVRAATNIIPDSVATLWVLDEGTGSPSGLDWWGRRPRPAGQSPWPRSRRTLNSRTPSGPGPRASTPPSSCR